MASRLAAEFLLDGHVESRTLGQVGIALFIQRGWIFENREGVLQERFRLAPIIPVIFLSALTETQDKVKAFRTGAVDYVSKPLQFEEVHARIETHLKLHGLQRALRLRNEHLEEAVAARTRELAEANERLTILDSSKNDFLRLISHELRTPLNGLFGVAELILEEMSSSDENNELA